MSIRRKSQQFALTTTTVAALMLLAACVTRHVPDGKYLLKKNVVEVKGDEMDKSELSKVIRQQPNTRTLLGPKIRLIAYNSIDSTKTEEKRIKRYNKLQNKNKRRIAKERRINEKRRNKVIAKLERLEAKNAERVRQGRREIPIVHGDSTYFYRSIKLKDTLNPKLTWRERLKYKFGEAPVIVDPALFERSQEQLHLYMHKKGYYYDSVSARLDTIKGKKKITAHYYVVTGPRYYIDSVSISTDNPEIAGNFAKFTKKVRDKYEYNTAFYNYLYADVKKPFRIPLDNDALNDYKNIMAKFMRDEAIYGFNPSHISYVGDTNRAEMTMSLRIEFNDRVVKTPEGDSLSTVPLKTTKVRNVYFHICDTVLYEGNFRAYVEDTLKLELLKAGFLQTVDTIYYSELYRKAENRNDGDDKKVTYFKSRVERNVFGYKDSVELNPFREATFVFNGELFVQAGLLEAQNYLEQTNYYKEYYFDRTYNRLLQLGLFSVIKPEITETYPGSGYVDVHYYLIPSKKQSYSFEPRATNSNGFLGVSASVNYTNKNLFKSGWLTTLSLSGGFESQPPVFDKTVDGKEVKTSGRSFNTFEIGPTLKFDLPGFLPINVAKLPKRSRPRTVISTAYNFQDRPDFKREIFQMNFLWKLYVGKTQVVSAGVPFASVIKFVTIDKNPEFEQDIEEQNDLFLRNAYSNQLIWEDFKVIFDYDNREADNKKNEKLRLALNSTFNMAGNTLSLWRSSQETDADGHKQAFGVTYSQFVLLDTKFISYYSFNRRRVLAMRTLAGVGVPYGNTPTSLPYDYSFFAGGSNDNRGFLARALGPGSYKYYMDSNRTATQIGDIRLGASLELRLGDGLLNSAFFMDVGNVWTFNDDENRPGGKFSKNWYKELGLSVGYGIRIDFEFFVVRADLGFPITNPALPEGARWVFQSREPYLEDLNTLTQDERDKLSKPFTPRLNIGIGFPF